MSLCKISIACTFFDTPRGAIFLRLVSNAVARQISQKLVTRSNGKNHCETNSMCFVLNKKSTFITGNEVPRFLKVNTVDCNKLKKINDSNWEARLFQMKRYLRRIGFYFPFVSRAPLLVVSPCG